MLVFAILWPLSAIAIGYVAHIQDRDPVIWGLFTLVVSPIVTLITLTLLAPEEPDS